MTLRHIQAFLLVLCCGVLISGGIYAYLYQRSLQPLEPMEEPSVIAPLPAPNLQVYFGFLPFWLMKGAYIPPSLTDVAYFNIPIAADGNWQKKDGKTANPGWRTFQSDAFANLRIQTLQQKQRLVLTLSMLDNATIEEFLQNPDAQRQCIANTESLLQEFSIDGINLDFEYTAKVSPELRAAFTRFIAQFSAATQTHSPAPILSIDIYANAAKANQLWDLNGLSPHIKYFVLMGYDFHHRSSSTAGPVAPLYGKSLGRWDADLMTSFKSILEVIQPKQLILGIPLYGYEWQTTTDTLGATTFPKTGKVASLKRVRQLFQLPSSMVRWDWDSLSPYLTYSNGGSIQVISFENEQSLRYKLDTAKQAGFAGVAFWALGYAEADDPVWNLLP